MGRHAHTARDGGQHAPRPLVATQYGSSGRLTFRGEPSGWSRPDFTVVEQSLIENVRRLIRTFDSQMKSADNIKTFIRRTVAEQLPQVEPRGVREWISARLTHPYRVQLPVDPEGTQLEDFWMVTDHKDGKHYRIAFSPRGNAFGIAQTNESISSGATFSSNASAFVFGKSKKGQAGLPRSQPGKNLPE